MQPVVVTGKDDHWVARNYGSRRGFLLTYWHHLLYLLGRYRKYRKVDWQSIERLVFVCKGNICRSAYAEAVSRSMGVEAISCGLDTIENAPANIDAICNAIALGFDLKGHKTTPIMYLVIRKSDLLIAMEPWQCNFLQRSLHRKHQITLLGLWSRPIFPHIQDPYGASPYYFKKCFEYIKSSVNELSKKIKK